ncbi:MAG TPA: 30S ribosomal protein S13 [Candidatus Omnitrophota bacterium]|jgi:small subunit ribosomal protein S13|nr:30S ribosomal protein S13 [Candidatus Omnitrophota bacterium]HRY84946.1 30S ribosomal protein S13 [Candidatus Omnitrophota bacterium]
MPRIIGVDIPREKRIDVALTYLYGVGKTLSKKILNEAKVDLAKRAKDLTEAEVSVITGIIQRTLKVEGDLRRDIQTNIKRLMDIRCYRGSRHLKGLPCRGQRTHTNARTRKGKRKTVGGLNRAAPAPK